MQEQELNNEPGSNNNQNPRPNKTETFIKRNKNTMWALFMIMSILVPVLLHYL